MVTTVPNARLSETIFKTQRNAIFHVTQMKATCILRYSKENYWELRLISILLYFKYFNNSSYDKSENFGSTDF